VDSSGATAQFCEAQLCSELRVYACGGDGTLNECVCGAAGKANVAVTHFPGGTGNDFVRCFGAEQERFRSLDELLNGELRKFDVIDCNGRCSINICSVGIDARIGTDVHKYSKLPLVGGATAYVVSAVANLIKGVQEPLRITCDGAVFEGQISLACACNGSYYGGGFHPVPEARPDDGIMDILIVKGVSRLSFIGMIGAYSKGEYARMPKHITHLQAGQLEIESEHELVVNVDGEAIHGKKIRIQLRRGGVNFIVPAGMAYFSEMSGTGS